MPFSRNARRTSASFLGTSEFPIAVFTPASPAERGSAGVGPSRRRGQLASPRAEKGVSSPLISPALSTPRLLGARFEANGARDGDGGDVHDRVYVCALLQHVDRFSHAQHDWTDHVAVPEATE